jgi:hypothetical protein
MVERPGRDRDATRHGSGAFDKKRRDRARRRVGPHEIRNLERWRLARRRVGRRPGTNREWRREIALEGSRWQGEGLNVETHNGGVHLELPAGYNAELHTETNNGGIDIDFPITVSGRLSDVRRRIDTTIGSGGPPLRLRTVERRRQDRAAGEASSSGSTSGPLPAS